MEVLIVLIFGRRVLSMSSTTGTARILEDGGQLSLRP